MVKPFSAFLGWLWITNVSPLLPSVLSAVGPYIGRYCGQNTPGRIISYTGILALTINTDSAIAKEGFSANFTVIERTVPEGEPCKENRRTPQPELKINKKTCKKQEKNQSRGVCSVKKTVRKPAGSEVTTGGVFMHVRRSRCCPVTADSHLLNTV